MTSASVSWSGNTLTVGPNGLVWQRADGERIERTWDRVSSLMTFAASSTVNGIHVGSWQHLGLTLDDGLGFTFHTRAKEAFEVAPLLMRYAAPVVAGKVLAQLQAGQKVHFGPVWLTSTEIGFKKKSWPISEIAGHRTDQGHWMMDVGPKAKPKLVAQVMLNKLPNYIGLVSALDRLAPGTDYGPNAPDLGTMFRPSASSHDPRYPSGRTRLLILGGLFGTIALIGAVFLTLQAIDDHQRHEREKAQFSRIAALVKVAEAAPVAVGQPFACELPSKSPYEFAFVTRGDEGAPRTGLTTKEMPFSLTSSGTSVLGSHSRFTHVVFGEVRAPAQGVVTVSLRVVDEAASKVVCAGELSARLPSNESYVASAAAESLLLYAVCRGSDEVGCSKTTSYPLVEPAPVAAEPTATEPPPPSDVEAKPAKNVKPVKAKAEKNGLEAAQIQRVVRSNFGRYRLCYENGLRSNPNLAGKVAVRLAIAPSGAVASATDDGSTLPAPAVVACILKASGGLSFPAAKSGSTVVYPIVFGPGG